MGNFLSPGWGDGLVSGALGMIGGAISDRRNYRNQKKLMGLQNEYNLNLHNLPFSFPFALIGYIFIVCLM